MLEWAGLTAVVVAFAVACGGGADGEKTYERPTEYRPETVKRPAEVDENTKGAALIVVTLKIINSGGPDIGMAFNDWEVYSDPELAVHYAAYKRDAVWCIEDVNSYVYAFNEAARNIAPNVPVPPNYDVSKEVTYNKMIANLRAR